MTFRGDHKVQAIQVRIRKFATPATFCVGRARENKAHENKNGKYVIRHHKLPISSGILLIAILSAKFMKPAIQEPLIPRNSIPITVRTCVYIGF